MTAEQIMLHVDTIGATEFTMEERRHLKRFFLHEYCSAWMSISAIGRATGLLTSSRQMVYRSIKLVQNNRQYWLMSHKINTAIKEKISPPRRDPPIYRWNIKRDV